MSTQQFQQLFRPTSVAVIGGSDEEGSPGRVIMRNLTEGKFLGPVMPVDKEQRPIAGLESYRSIDTLPLTPDLAILCDPPGDIPEYITELGKRGTKAAVILSRGSFRVPLEQREDRRRALREAARPFGLRVLGPNCLGFINPAVGINASLAHTDALPGKVAFVSQSDALFTSVLDWASSRGVGFSHFISLGDRFDIHFGDILDFLNADPHTRAVLLYVETIVNARGFMSAARATARNKPVLVMKAGVSREASIAAAAHSGAYLGADDVYDAAMRRAGMLRVFDIDTLFDAVETLAKTKPLRGPRLAILTNGGGPGFLAVDRLIAGGGKLAEITSEGRQALDERLGDQYSYLNPLVIRSYSPPEAYADALSVLLKDHGVDAVLVMHVPTATVPSTDIAEAVIKACKKVKRNVLTSWIGLGDAEESREMFAKANIPTYFTPENAIRGFLNMAEYRANQELLMETPASLPAEFDPDASLVRSIAAKALEEKRQILTSHEVEEIMAAYEIPVRLDQPKDFVHELLLEVSTDPVFGPVIRFGQGGRLTEVANDRQAAMPPLNTTLAKECIRRTRVYQFLKGSQSLPQTNLEELCLTMVKISQLIIDVPEIFELEINPLYADKDGVWAESAHISVVKAKQAGPEQLAVRPYPRELEECALLKDGRQVHLRPIRPEDEPEHWEFLQHVSAEDKRYRFFGNVGDLPRTEMTKLTQIDYDREMAFLAKGPADDEEDKTLGVVRAMTAPDNTHAEFAILVRSDMKRLGLGHILMAKIIRYCKSRGTHRIEGQALLDNSAMAGLAKAAGFDVKKNYEDDVWEFNLFLNPS